MVRGGHLLQTGVGTLRSAWVGSAVLGCPVPLGDLEDPPMTEEGSKREDHADCLQRAVHWPQASRASGLGGRGAACGSTLQVAGMNVSA